MNMCLIWSEFGRMGKAESTRQRGQKNRTEIRGKMSIQMVLLDVTTTRNAQAQDEYILKGRGVEQFEPRFTYHGFRYVRLRGYPGIPGPEALKACLVCSDVAPGPVLLWQ